MIGEGRNGDQVWRTNNRNIDGFQGADLEFAPFAKTPGLAAGRVHKWEHPDRTPEAGENHVVFLLRQPSYLP